MGSPGPYLYNDTQRTQCSPCLIVFPDIALYCPRSLIRIMKHAAFLTCSGMFRIFLKSSLSLLLSCHSQISLLRSLNLGHARRIWLVASSILVCGIDDSGTFRWKRNCRRPIFSIRIWMIIELRALCNDLCSWKILCVRVSVSIT